MTLLYADPAFLEHDTGDHPERAARLEAIQTRLEAESLIEKCRRRPWNEATAAELSRNHDAQYQRQVAQLAARGGGRIEVDTWVSKASDRVAKLAAGAVCDAVREVVAGRETNAFCLVRPPGHHALRQGAMGFCLFNNIAIGAALALNELKLERVLIVDWDVHHGNGTQASFWEEPRAGFLSIHRYPFYPGSGARDETGGGPALGNTVNIPLPFGTSRADFLKALETGVAALAAKIKPQLLLVSAGFDAHRTDPIGSLGLEVEDYAAIGRLMTAVADQYCDGKMVSVLEGGYNPRVLAECVDVYLRELLTADARRAKPNAE